MHGTVEERQCQRGRDEELALSKNGNGKRRNKPYLGVERCLEFGRRVGTLLPNLRFRMLLKSATCQFWNLYPSGTSARDPTCQRFEVENSS